MSPREKAERCLGKAVHPKALDRLFELAPEAEVGVHHHVSTWDGRQITTVTIGLPVGHEIHATAKVHPRDQFRRRYGIDLAFRRGLRKVKEVSEGARA